MEISRFGRVPQSVRPKMTVAHRLTPTNSGDTFISERSIQKNNIFFGNDKNPSLSEMKANLATLEKKYIKQRGSLTGTNLGAEETNQVFSRTEEKALSNEIERLKREISNAKKLNPEESGSEDEEGWKKVPQPKSSSS
jgi:hypothetical protein